MTQQATDLIGAILGGHYRVTQVLASGGQSETYVAEDLHLPGHPRRVVKRLKTANRDSDSLANARRLFQREAEVLQQSLCRIDQIPNLYAYFEEDQEFYLVQELIEGHTLSSEISPQVNWSESQVTRLLVEVLTLLTFVHGCGIIHRDLKPDNLIRRPDGKLVLIDFGAVKQVVREMEEQSRTVSIGTLGYMPLEQLQGRPTPASDLYALGMIAIQALTSIPPRKLRENTEGELEWRDQVEVSDPLARILTRLTRRQHQQRYQSAQEVLQALRSHADPDQTSVFLDSSPPISSSPSVSASSPSSTLTSPPFTPTPADSRPQLSPRSQIWRRIWPWLALAVFGIGSLGWLRRPDPVLMGIEDLTEAGMYYECIDMSSSVLRAHSYIDEEPSFMHSVQELQGHCQLSWAETLAEQGNYDEAMSLAEQITPAVPAYQPAQNQMRLWSAQAQRQRATSVPSADPDPESEALEDVSFTRLRSHLEAGQWQKADVETDRVLLMAADRQQEEFLTVESIETFSCEALDRIDSLWRNYSNGKFGLSVQRPIWTDAAHDGAPFRDFATEVGWRVEGEYRTYDQIDQGLRASLEQAPAGSMPFAAVARGFVYYDYTVAPGPFTEAWWLYQSEAHFDALMDRLETCGIS